MFAPLRLCLAIAGSLAIHSLLAGQGWAAITFVGSSGSLAAEVTFDQSGSDLIITLTNTSSADVLVPSDVLTGVFFQLSTQESLTRVSALLNAGSTVFYDPDGQPVGGVVGGEFAYKDDVAGSEGPGDGAYGISSTGLDDAFGPGDLFPGPDLASPLSPDGPQYGILSAGDNTSTGNSGVTDSGGMIKNSVVFTLSGLSSNFDLAGVTDVWFQYGTSLAQPSFEGEEKDDSDLPGVPEPASIAAWLLGAGAFGFVLRRRVKKDAA